MKLRTKVLKVQAPALLQQAKKGDEPIDDYGVPQFLNVLEIIRLHGHRDMGFPNTPALGSPVKWADFDIVVDACCLLPNFSDADADKAAKDRKGSALSAIGAVLNSSCAGMPQKSREKLLDMLQINIFRPIPRTPDRFLAADAEPFMVDQTWQHLEPVYDVLQKAWTAVPQMFDGMVQSGLEGRIMHQMGAPDGRERDAVVAFLDAYCDVRKEREPMIWRELGEMLALYQAGAVDPYCCPPILILFRNRLGKSPDWAVVEGVFGKFVIPTLSGRHFAGYSDRLLEVTSLMIDHQPRWALRVADEALRRWPDTRPTKAVLFLAFLMKVIERLPPADFASFAPRLFTHYSRIAQHQSSKVVEASFKLVANVSVIPRILDNTRAIYPMYFAALGRCMKEHWKSNSQSAALNCWRQLHDIDPFICDELNLSLGKRPKGPPAPDPLAMARERAHKNWAQIARLAGRRDQGVDVGKTLTVIQRAFAGKT